MEAISATQRLVSLDAFRGAVMAFMIVVNNNGTNSNTVTVPVAATSPGVYTLDQSGSGAGAILHADFSLVNAGNPAAAGETVLVYLTGMGTVTPNVNDGTAGQAGTLYRANAGISSKAWPSRCRTSTPSSS